MATLRGSVTLTETTTIELQHYANTGKSTNGLGVETNDGGPEVYADILIKTR